MPITFIGIDCATQAKKTGLALGTFDNNQGTLEAVSTGASKASIIDTLSAWMSRTPTTLLALDSPLGWPAPLGKNLASHKAGQPLEEEANRLFRRLTDRVIKQRIGKQSLDVGADRIARTAHAALRLIQQLRERTNETIPLAWETPLAPGAYAIEVYPAATLTAYGVSSRGYKGKQGSKARAKLVTFLQERLSCPEETIASMRRSDDALDAALCVLAGVDFLRGEVIEPTDIDLARKEGWIWVKK